VLLSVDQCCIIKLNGRFEPTGAGMPPRNIMIPTWPKRTDSGHG